MADTYTKLFSSIVTSTIWQENHATRILWVTMLALSDANGIVEGSIPGLAHVAGISIEECEEGLAKLSSPDRYSRSQEHDGRRIEAVEGGWLILNRTKYRDKQTDRKEYMRNYMKERRANDEETVNNDVNNVNICKQSVTQTKTKAKTETKKEINTSSNPNSNKVINDINNPNTNPENCPCQKNSSSFLQLGLKIADTLQKQFAPFTEKESKTFRRLARHLADFGADYTATGEFGKDFMPVIQEWINLAKQDHIKKPKAMFVDLCKKHTGYQATRRAI